MGRVILGNALLGGAAAVFVCWWMNSIEQAMSDGRGDNVFIMTSRTGTIVMVLGVAVGWTLSAYTEWLIATSGRMLLIAVAPAVGASGTTYVAFSLLLIPEPFSVLQIAGFAVFVGCLLLGVAVREKIIA